MNKIMKTTLYHEAGHVIAFAAFGIPFDEIEIAIDGKRGGVYGGDDRHLTKRQQTIIDIAGLAGECIAHESCGVVRTYKKMKDNVVPVDIPRSIQGEDGDLAHIYEVGFEGQYGTKFGAEDEYLNGILKEAWDILQRNKAQFKELVELLKKREVGYRTDSQECADDEYGCAVWHFDFRDYQHILAKVEPVHQKVAA